MKNSLGIIGGVGPLASAYFYKMLTEKTKATKDQEHLNIILLSHATIPDRTDFILGKSKENPYPYLLEDAKTLEKMGAKMIIIPCNTSCYFNDKLNQNVNIPINNLVKDTALYIKEKGFKKAGILATKGTIYSNLYQNALKENNINFSVINNEKVMDLIYNYIKAGKKVTLELFENIIKDADVDCFILGCTELSILKEKLNLNDTFIDPLEVQVNKILNFFNKERSN